MGRKEDLDKLRDEVFPIINPKENNQPCKTCRYWQKECAVDLSVVYLKNGNAILICAMQVRDYIKRRQKNKAKKNKPK